MDDPNKKTPGSDPSDTGEPETYLEARQSGDVFRDDPEALEQMARYQAFLNLQNEADYLTDEEYLARYDELMAANYGDGYADSGYASGGMSGIGPYDGKNLDQIPATAADDALADGECLPEEDPESEPEETPESEREEDFPEENPESEPGEDPESEPEDGLPEDNPEENPEDGIVSGTDASGGNGAPFPDGTEAEPESELEDGSPDAPGKDPDFPEDGPASHAVPDLDDEDDGPGQPEQQGWHVEETQAQIEITESFTPHDALDQAAMATGLAGAVETMEYIPPQETLVKDAPAQEPETEKQQDGPMMQKMNRMTEEIDRNQPDYQPAPQGPDR